MRCVRGVGFIYRTSAVKKLACIIVIIAVIGIALCTSFCFGISKGRAKCINNAIEHTDTLYIRDTITVEMPREVTRYIVRTDTVTLQSIDTVMVVVQIPIERVVYSDSTRYRLTVEGYNPRLTDIQLYTVDRIITKEILKKPRWAVNIGGGVGYTTGGFYPYVGISVGYVIWSR